MLAVQLLLQRSWVCCLCILGVLVLLFNVVIVELCVHVVLVVHPSLHLVRVLLVEVGRRRSTVDENVFAVKAHMVSSERLVSPKNHLAPQVGVLSAFVHGSVGFEVMLDVELVLFEHGVDLVLGGCGVTEYFIEVSPNPILFIMKTIEVDSLNGVDVLGHQFAEHAPEKRC